MLGERTDLHKTRLDNIRALSDLVSKHIDGQLTLTLDQIFFVYKSIIDINNEILFDALDTYSNLDEDTKNKLDQETLKQHNDSDTEPIEAKDIYNRFLEYRDYKKDLNLIIREFVFLKRDEQLNFIKDNPQYSFLMELFGKKHQKSRTKSL